MNREILFSGKKFQVVRDSTSMPGGEIIQREVILHPGAVVILPFLDQQKVCMVRNYRHAIGETLIEMPAGTLEPPEPPEEAAIREFAEETGYRATRWRKLAEFHPSPGVMNEKMFLFAAAGLQPGETSLQPGEVIETIVVPWDEALSGVMEGTIKDAKTMVGILLWERLRNAGQNPLFD